EVRLLNAEFLLPAGAAVSSVKVAEASLAAEGANSVRFTAGLSSGARDVSIEASATRDPLSQLIENVDLRAHSEAPADAPPGATATALGTLDVAIRGVEGDAATPFRLAADISAQEGAIDFGSD